MTAKHSTFALFAFPPLLPLLAVPLAAQGREPKAPAAAASPTKASGGPMQEPSRAELEQKLADKLHKPFLKAASWTTDYDAARRQAKADKRLVFAYFTRSYAH